MKHDFDKVVNRTGTYSIKWDGKALMKAFGMDGKFDEETIPLMVADMDFECAPAIKAAMHKVADFGIYGYTMSATEPKYNEAIINWYKKRYNTTIHDDEIIYSPGSVEAVNHAIVAFSSVGDGIIICRPVYGHFTDGIKELYRVPVSSHLVNDGNGYYTMNWEDFEAKCAVPSNRVFILCSPANPVGRVWKKDELQKMAAICKKYNVILVSDEVHSDILRKGVKHTTILNAVEDYSNIIFVTAINKTFNVAGLACANVIIPDKQLRGVYRKDFGMKMITPFGIAALVAAYGESEDWVEALNEYIDESVDWALEFIKTNLPKVKVFKPEGTYMLWLDFTAYGLSDAEVHKKIYYDANVMLQDGIVHDPEHGQCFQRVCLPAARSVLKTAFERIANEFKGL